ALGLEGDGDGGRGFDDDAAAWMAFGVRLAGDGFQAQVADLGALGAVVSAAAQGAEDAGEGGALGLHQDPGVVAVGGAVVGVVGGDAPAGADLVEQFVPVGLGVALADLLAGVVVDLDRHVAVQRRQVGDGVPAPVGMADDRLPTLRLDLGDDV